MPNENIERAIKRGIGAGSDARELELVYEGYASGGVGLLIEATTDNKNRTAADLRLVFSTSTTGTFASSGSVAYLFKRKGQINVPRAAIDEDELLELALEAGAEDVASDEDYHLVTTAHDQLYAVACALKASGLTAEAQKLIYIPETSVPLADETAAAQVLRLCDALKDNEDVQDVHANFDLSKELLT